MGQGWEVVVVRVSASGVFILRASQMPSATQCNIQGVVMWMGMSQLLVYINIFCLHQGKRLDFIPVLLHGSTGKGRRQAAQASVQALV